MKTLHSSRETQQIRRKINVCKSNNRKNMQRFEKDLGYIENFKFWFNACYSKINPVDF